MSTWETLLARALVILRSAASAGSLAREWSLGGGTALMLRHGHRRSEDIDIFVPDPQVLGLLTPRLNPVAESLTPDYAEGATYVKLYFPEGQVDFIVSRHITPVPVTRETLIGREIPVETSAEVLGKKLWHRACAFTARDFSTSPTWRAPNQRRSRRSSTSWSTAWKPSPGGLNREQTCFRSSTRRSTP